MTIRVTGLNSGLDTDSIIKELVSAYRSKGDKIKKQQIKLSWTQDKWKSLNAKVLNLYKSLDSLRFSTGYNMKKTTVSDSTKATVTADKDAINGTQTLRIKEVAKGGYLTGAKLENSKKKGKASTLADLGYDASKGSGTYRISGNGVTQDIEIKGDTTISEFIDQINKSGTGVQASFDETNQRLFISAKQTGKDADFTLTALDSNGQAALSALGVNVDSKTSSAQAAAWMKYYDSDPDQIVANLAADVENLAKAKWDKDRLSTEIEDKQAKNSKLTGAVNYIDTVKKVNDVDAVIGNKAEAQALSDLANMSETDRKKEYVIEYEDDGEYKGLRLANDTDLPADRVTYDKLINDYNISETQPKLENGNPALDENNNPIMVESDILTKIKAYNSNLKAQAAYEGEDANKDYVKAVEDAQLPGSAKDIDALRTEYKDEFDANKTRIGDAQTELEEAEEKILSYKTIDSSAITKEMGDPSNASANTDIQTQAEALAKKVEYFKDNYSLADPTKPYDADNNPYKLNNSNTGASKVNGQDAVIELNDAEFTSSTNSFNINGLTIQAQAKTTEDITITTATDTQGLYDKIKDFISEYNSIINEMSTLYNAPSAKGYEPLTSEEKEALSDSDVAEWEKKVKDSLLRRDGNLSTLMNVMTSAMSASYTVNGKTYSLASLGIKTGSYFTTTAANRYELHIDGDADDDTVSANADKLMAMLNSDPDTVIGIIQGAANKLSEDLGKQMKSSTLRSFQSIYNDKSMAQSYSDYTKKISAWEEKVTAMEDKYYKQFAAMETALAKLQSQQSAFAGMLGS